MKLTYPDAEVLTYQYGSGGLVKSAAGAKGNFTYDYIKRLEYDKFEQRAFIVYGNNTRTTYTYNAQNRRLSNLKSGKGDGSLFQNLNYGYDNVGNILSLANNVPVPPPSQFGGPTTQSFGYDDLYRLTSASGTYQFSPDKTDRYTLSMVYDNIHNILLKQQNNEIVQLSGAPITQKKTTYTWNYSFDSSKPHAPTHIGDRTFSYDANGNQLGWVHDQNGTKRTITWDEENRIQSIYDNGQEKTYKYNDTGERVIKRGPQGETVYVNQYFVIRNKEIGTKHVYAGTTRVVSKLMKQDKPGANPQGQTPLEKDLYFYHPDHLGSSNYITDTNGKLYEHLEYFPFGETWVEEASNNTQRTPYLFTSKELDVETGLYYFGARYYDPRTSVWQSGDMALEDYVNARRSGDGVFYPLNLNLYSYAQNNPQINVDPTGNEPVRLFAGTVYDLKRALDTSPSKVGLTIGQASERSLLKFGETEWTFRRGPVPKITYLNTQKGRYVYTTKGGWIDMSHFMFYAARAYGEKLQGGKNPIGEAIQEGYRQEFIDSLVSPWSAYSYEDLPSDKFGAIFGGQIFDPKSSKTLSEQVEVYLKSLGVTEPTAAPNWAKVPMNDKVARENFEKGKMIINPSTKPMFTKETE